MDSTSCRVSSVGASASMKVGEPSASQRYTPSSTRQWRWVEVARPAASGLRDRGGLCLFRVGLAHRWLFKANGREPFARGRMNVGFGRRPACGGYGQHGLKRDAQPFPPLLFSIPAGSLSAMAARSGSTTRLTRQAARFHCAMTKCWRWLTPTSVAGSSMRRT